MLVKYIRCGVRPVGCVVATGAGKVGWSVCHPNDEFNKDRAKVIAAGRADLGTNAKLPNKQVWNPEIVHRDVIDLTVEDVTVDLADVMNKEVSIMEARSIRYFK
jgi:hypothetical protein